MANHLAPVPNRAPMLQTTSSLASRVEDAKLILARPITPTQAVENAKRITGSFANLKPDNPGQFIESIAAVLVDYPAGLVTECAHPRIGIARKVEFLSVKSLTDWLDSRLAFYQSLAGYVPRQLALPEREFTVEECNQGLAAMRGLKRAMLNGGAENLTFEQAVQLGSK